MLTQETTPKYTLWGETDSKTFKHDREPNAKATWTEVAELMFTPETKIYEEDDIPRIRWDISVNDQDEVLVMDCTPDCRHLYWYLESHPG